MTKQPSVGSYPDSEVYPSPSLISNIGHVNITGGNFSQDNSQTNNIRDEWTIFNEQVSGYIRSAKTKGPITAVSMPSHSPPINRDESDNPPRIRRSTDDQGRSAHYKPCRTTVESAREPPQRIRRSTGDGVTPPQNRDAPGRGKKLGRLKVRVPGGDEYPPPTSRSPEIHDEFSQLSPRMKKFVEDLETRHGMAKKDRKEQRYAARSPVSPQRLRRVDRMAG